MVRWWVLVPSGQCLALFIILRWVKVHVESLEMKHQKWNSLWKKGKVGKNSLPTGEDKFAFGTKRMETKECFPFFWFPDLVMLKMKSCSVDSFFVAPNGWWVISCYGCCCLPNLPYDNSIFSFQFKLLYLWFNLVIPAEAILQWNLVPTIDLKAPFS